jgi:uncharacterized pyridoxal phosphate-containing UPF0001 family protein
VGVPQLLLARTASTAALGADAFDRRPQELLEKQPQMPQDTAWHFIGHLQSNKAKLLVKSVPNLVMLETVDTSKVNSRQANLRFGMPCLSLPTESGGDEVGACSLRTCWIRRWWRRSGSAGYESWCRYVPKTLTCYAVVLARGCSQAPSHTRVTLGAQVNTSGEESKFGVEPGEQCLGLCRHVHEECTHLELAGLMTIGMPDYTSRPQNFECLQACRQQVASALGLEVRRTCTCLAHLRIEFMVGLKWSGDTAASVGEHCQLRL